MPRAPAGQESQADLRLRALSRLTGGDASASDRVDSIAAFQALYELASSPSTAPRALALLHELQVHQVELELQDEELRRSRSELETALIRQTQLYDHAPVGCFTIDRTTAMRELNLTGARMLGLEREALVGRPLDGFLAADSARELRALLARLGQGAGAQRCALRLAVGDSAPDVVHASIVLDPDRTHFLLALLDAVAAEELRSS